ncbi:MAG: type II toxin-antitoxin system death-on-curing family toxin [Dermatophilaceae bacterium]
MTEFLTLEDLLTLVGDLGVGPVRDLGLVDAAAARPRTSLFGRDAYPSLDEKATVLLESLVRNHPLVDGNKRLGWLATVVFYGLNGRTIDVDDDPAYDLVIEVATGRTDYQRAAARLAAWH